MEQVFTEIFKNNSWRSEESLSGPSSTLARTRQLREALPILFRRYAFTRVFDGPCGDFNWMQHILNECQIEYIGGDIVKELIEDNKARYEKLPAVKFMHLDITKDTLPSADLMICRDCLFHLSYKDTKKFLCNFLASDINFLLTTTHKNSGNINNKDIVTGDWRWMDLYQSPYNFPMSSLELILDGTDRFMVMWDKEQVKNVLLEWI